MCSDFPDSWRKFSLAFITSDFFTVVLTLGALCPMCRECMFVCIFECLNVSFLLVLLHQKYIYYILMTIKFRILIQKLMCSIQLFLYFSVFFGQISHFFYVYFSFNVMLRKSRQNYFHIILYAVIDFILSFRY